MKNVCTLLFILVLSGINAQIIYKENDGPKVGTKIKEEFLEDISGFDLQDYTNPGGNQNWEVSGSTQSDVPYEYISVDGLPFKGMFPGCNLAEQSIPNPDSSYSMYQTNSAGLRLIGTYTPETQIVFSQPILLVKYPLSFGDSYQNDVMATFETGGFPAQVDIKTNTVVDAWGVMKTDKGSFPCLRFKNVQILELFVLGVPFGSQTFTNYGWVANGFAQPVANLTYIELEDNTGIFSDTSFAILDEQEIVANTDLKKGKMNLKLSPNPVSNELNISVQDVTFNEAVYAIIDAQGKTLIQGQVYDHEKIQLDLSKLVPGNYLVQLVLDQKTTLIDIVSKQ